ncbi:MAG: nuclear transport factor 2 family protein [Chloroflexi bacterium]|nr:nuclear transport factor 2 family protein [Chloroflexota bacterium]MYE47221.1 nuclear transport factor 2 family protein [Chloroflexota bacterium]
MTAADRLDILEQIGRYSYAVDAFDGDEFAARFTEDGVFERRAIGSDGPYEVIEGRAALRRWILGLLETLPEGVMTRHHQRATVFEELSADAASTRTMLLLTSIAPGDRHPRTVSSGVYRDEWRRTDEGWRIARRVADMDRPAPDAARG